MGPSLPHFFSSEPFHKNIVNSIGALPPKKFVEPHQKKFLIKKKIIIIIKKIDSSQKRIFGLPQKTKILPPEKEKKKNSNVHVYLCTPLIKIIFLGLSLALKSHDQIPAFHWSSPPAPLITKFFLAQCFNLAIYSSIFFSIQPFLLQIICWCNFTFN